jgi:endoglycosylceramidase
MKNLVVTSLLLLLMSGCSYLNKFIEQPDMKKIRFIHDEQSRIVIYHGVNESNFSKSSPNNQPWQEEKDVAWISSRGINLSRYLVFTSAIMPQHHVFDTAYMRMTIDNVKLRGKHGIDVVVDIHQDLFSAKFSGDGFPEWMIRDNGIAFSGPTKPWNLAYLDRAVVTTFDNFWNNDTLIDAYIEMLEYVFQTLDTIPNVVGIDVFNEPFPDLSCKFEKKKLTNFYQRIYQMKRDRCFTKQMFFEPWMSTSSGIASNLRFVPAFGGTVYTPHYYDMFIDAQKPYGPLNHELMKKAIAIKVLEANDYNSPLVFGEFGAVNGYTDYISDFVTELDRYCAGWIYWSYDPNKYNDYGIINDDGTEKDVMKALVRIYPQKIAGSKPVFEFKNKVFTLTYDATVSALTVIFIPPGLQYTVETKGSWIVSGQKLLYTNTNDVVQNIRIVCK